MWEIQTSMNSSRSCSISHGRLSDTKLFPLNPHANPGKCNLTKVKCTTKVKVSEMNETSMGCVCNSLDVEGLCCVYMEVN